MSKTTFEGKVIPVSIEQRDRVRDAIPEGAVVVNLEDVPPAFTQYWGAVERVLTAMHVPLTTPAYECFRVGNGSNVSYMCYCSFQSVGPNGVALVDFIVGDTPRVRELN